MAQAVCGPVLATSEVRGCWGYYLHISTEQYFNLILNI